MSEGHGRGAVPALRIVMNMVNAAAPLPCPRSEGSAFGFQYFRGPRWVYLRYGPVARSPSLLDDFVKRLQDSQSPSFLLFKLRGLNSYPDGTFTHCSCQPSLDAHFSVPISRDSKKRVWT
jgi:hypothetical protein